MACRSPLTLWLFDSLTLWGAQVPHMPGCNRVLLSRGVSASPRTGLNRPGFRRHCSKAVDYSSLCFLCNMLRRNDGDETDLVWICATWDNTRRCPWPLSSSVWICCLCWSVSGSCSCSWAGLSSLRLARLPVLVYLLVYPFIHFKISGDNVQGHPYARRLFINLLKTADFNRY
jgi:hypothetical protein